MKFSNFSLLTAMLCVSLSNLVLLWGCLLLYLIYSEISPWTDLILIHCSLLSFWNENLYDILHSVILMCSLMWWLLNNLYIHGGNTFLSLLIFSVYPELGLLGFYWFLSKFMRTESVYFMVLFSNKPTSTCVILGNTNSNMKWLNTKYIIHIIMLYFIHIITCDVISITPFS